MRHKGTAKTPLGQVPELTPEQKQIQSLERRLKDEKATSKRRLGWYHESQVVAMKYEKEAAEWKALCSTSKTISEVSKWADNFWMERAKKYENELEEAKSGIMASKEIESLKENLKSAERLAADWRRNYYDLKDSYDRQKDKARGIHLSDPLDLPALVPPVKQKAAKGTKPKVKVSLICVKAGDSGQLDELSRYTSPGMVAGETGKSFYPINECGGAYFPAELFHISVAPIKLGKTFTELELLAKEAQERENQKKKD